MFCRAAILACHPSWPACFDAYHTLFFANNGRHGVHVDGDTTDWNLVDNWVSDSGGSAIYLKSAAGWQIRGNHLYATAEHAIFAEACFATAISGNYIEDFARNASSIAAPGPPRNSSADRYYGIGCRVQGGAATIISENKVFRFDLQSGRATGSYKAGVEFAYIGVDRVNYGTGQVNVIGNTVRRDGNGSADDVGLVYELGAGKTGRQLQLLSANNNVQVGPRSTPRRMDPAVTIVTPL